MRQYVSVTDFPNMEAGLAVASQVATLPTGTLDKLLVRASIRADGFCGRRLQAPQATTIGLGGVSIGATTIPLASTLGIDSKDEQGLIIGTGGAKETVLIVPGSVKTTLFTPPYPGTVTIAPPCLYAHAYNDPVQGVYVESGRTGSSSSDDIFQDVVTQQAQVAAVHAGGYSGLTGDRTRYHWLSQSPLQTIIAMQHAYPYTNEYINVDVPSLIVEQSTSRIRFPVGTFILKDGMLLTTYIAGYTIVPDDVQEAVAYYAVDALIPLIMSMSGGLGTSRITMGKRTVQYAIDAKSGKSQYALQAEAILTDGGYVR